jgi:hypothetical protein
VTTPMQYRLVQGDLETFERQLNAAADDGWTLHSFTTEGAVFTAVMEVHEPAGDKVW